MWCRGVVVITKGQLHSTNHEVSFYVSSTHARCLSEFRHAESLTMVAATNKVKHLSSSSSPLLNRNV